MTTPQIVWLRRDLRLADQAAFHAAAQAGPVVPVYILDDGRPQHHAYGGASRWWLHHSLESLAKDLQRNNSRLILRHGDVVEELCKVARETGARTVHALRHYEPWWRKAQGEIKERLDLRLYDGNYLMPPGSVTTGQGTPYKIFTPFWKELLRTYDAGEPLPEPRMVSPQTWPASDRLDDWQLQPRSLDWAGGFGRAWTPGSKGALDGLKAFADIASAYEDQRNLPSREGTSRLSPHLHFGEISPRQVWKTLEGRQGEGPASFRRELVWRDYAQNLICQFPGYASRSYREEFEAFPWRDPETEPEAAADLMAWQRGRTGYPIVDAGMRQLWHTGWMHNRIRMIAASFLVKHLLIDWRRGERWFWDTLVDADYANNSTNWQWVTGTGVDSSMFARIMAPLSQSEKFCAASYIRQWVSELAALDEPWIHNPEVHGCCPDNYPAPLIGHREGRERALAAHRVMKALRTPLR